MPTSVTAKEHLVENATSVVNNRTVLTSDGAITPREKPDGARDQFYISPSARAEYGLQDDEEGAWVRDPRVWSKDEPYERPQQVADYYRDIGHPGAVRLVHNRDMDRVTRGDLVLLAIKRPAMEAKQAAEAEATRAFTAEIDETDEGFEKATYGDRDEVRRNLSDRARRQMHEDHIQSGMIGPTAGLTLEEAARKHTPQEREQEAERFRRGSFHREFDAEDYAELMGFDKRSGGAPAGVRNDEKRRGRSIAIGETGLGKTTAQKVAARQPQGRR